MHLHLNGRWSSEGVATNVRLTVQLVHHVIFHSLLPGLPSGFGLSGTMLLS